jgi:cytochrome c oxidase subunit 1
VDRLFYLSTYFGLGHPEVYIIVAGFRYCISETNASIFGYRAMIMSIIAIGFLSTIVWGTHVCFWYESIFCSVFTLQH